jgi:hypothetical protein
MRVGGGGEEVGEYLISTPPPSSRNLLYTTQHVWGTGALGIQNTAKHMPYTVKWRRNGTLDWEERVQRNEKEGSYKDSIRNEKSGG